MKKAILLMVFCVALCVPVIAQLTRYSPAGDTTRYVELDGYVDAYYCFDVAEPRDGNRPYVETYSRHNEINVNLAYLSFRYGSERARATITPAFGTFINVNHAQGNAPFSNLAEANVGVKLSPKKRVWLDIGLMQAPFTSENGVALDQLLYSRSLGAEYTPYYFSGAKLTLPVHKKVNLYLYIMDGWQTRPNSLTPLGCTVQLEWKTDANRSFNLCLYRGNDAAAVLPGKNNERYLADASYTSTGKKLDLAVNAFYGRQFVTPDNGERQGYGWGQANINVRYRLNEIHSLAARYEYFYDLNDVVVTPVYRQFATSSYTFCYTHNFTPKICMRLEARYFAADVVIFKDANNKPANTGGTLLGGLLARF